MKIVISTINAKYIHLNNNTFQLAQAIKYEATIINQHLKQTEEEIIAELLNQNADIYCFGIYIWSSKLYQKITQILKNQNKNCIIIAGGPEYSYDPQFGFNTNPNLDYIISGEGEIPLQNLLAHLIDEEPLISTAISSKTSYNTTALPMNLADYQFNYLDKLDANTAQIFYLEASRGCTYNCSYCSSSNEKKSRKHTDENIFLQLDYAINHQYKNIKFLDRTFNLDDSWCITILDYIKKHAHPHQSFQFEVNIETLSKEFIDYLYTLPKNLVRFEVGIQSIYDEVNMAVFRKQNYEQLNRNILLLVNSPIDLHLDLIAGLPLETYAMFKNSFNACLNYHAKELQLGILKLLPATKLRKQAMQFQYDFDEEAPYTFRSSIFISKDDLANILLVENIVDRFYNKHLFTNTFNNQLDFDYLLGLAKHINKELISYQKHDLYLYWLDYDKSMLNDLIQDYYLNSKIKPKKIFNTIHKDDFKELRDLVIDELKININYFTKYVIIERLDNNSIFYKDFNTQCQNIIQRS